MSSTLQELAAERDAARAAIESLRLTPVLFELGARPHPPRELYRSYLEQSQVFVAVYWQSYGWVAPGEEISGLEDEFRLAVGKPRLVYVKEPADSRDPPLAALLDDVRGEGSLSCKKFETPEELRELIAQDLAVLVSERFHAPDAANARRMRDVPARATSFVARSEELAHVEELLADDGVRLITLSGPGGIGKTRLAVEAADRSRGRFPDGLAFVPLEGLESAELVPAAISTALGIRDAGPDTLGGVVAHLRGRSLLLLLDNFEHVVEAAPVVAALLEECAGLTVLVTSRELLHLRGEHELRVPPLQPDAEAAALFAERVGSTLQAFELGAEDAPLVAEICRRLDGVPLAIELAAPRLRLLSPEQLLDRLCERIALSGPRDAARQRTLEEAIAWSYELLQPAEPRVFERLSVLRGSFTFDSAAAVCALSQDELLELIASLLDKSVVYRLPETAEMRFGMLLAARVRARAARALGRSRRRVRGPDDVLRRARGAERVRVALRRAAGVEARARPQGGHVTRGARVAERARPGRRARHAAARHLAVVVAPRPDRGGPRIGRERPAARGAVGAGAARVADRDRRAVRVLPARPRGRPAAAGGGRQPLRGVRRPDRHRDGGHDRRLRDGDDRRRGRSAREAGPRAQELRGVGRRVGLDGRTGDDLPHPLDLRSLRRRGRPLRARPRAGRAGRRRAADRPGADEPRRLLVRDRRPRGVAQARRRAVALLDEAGVRYGAADVLESLARLEAAAGRHGQAAELVGTAAELRETLFLPLWGPIAERHERFVEGLREALGAEAFERQRDRGRSTPLDRWLPPAAAGRS